MAALLFFSCFLALTSFAQQKNLSGTVIGEDGVPIPGVTVVVKGTTTGTITDMDGKFLFAAAADSKILVISYIGMKSQEIEIGNQTVFNLTMAADVIGVDEVVVIDNGSSDKTVAIAKKMHANIILSPLKDFAKLRDIGKEQ